MQLRKMTWVLAALSAVAVMAACGGTGGSGRTDLTCSQDADCQGAEICHPEAKVCVQTCTSSTDCPNSAKTCDAISSADSRTVCKCTTDALCATDERVSGTTLTCSTAYSVCAPPGSASAKCTKDADCNAGQTCDTASGACVTPTAGCTKDADCSAGQVCDSGTCTNTTVGQACSGSSQSPCDYGQYCGSSSQCAAAPVAPTTCQNFSKSYPEWSAAGSNGPVIYSVALASYQANYTYCQSDAPDAFVLNVHAYRTDTTWPDKRAQVSGFFYVTTSDSESDAVNLLVPYTGYTVTPSNQKDAEFDIYLCRPSGSQTLQVGLYFTGGNPTCTQVSR